MDDEIRAFVRARHTTLLRRAYLLTGDREAAADLVQDALIRCCVAWRRRPPDNPEAARDEMWTVLQQLAPKQRAVLPGVDQSAVQLKARAVADVHAGRLRAGLNPVGP